MGGLSLVREAALLADQSALVTIDEDFGPQARSAAGERSSRSATENDVTASGDQFEHARPSPRLFEKVSATEAERIKAAVHEQVSADGPEVWYSGNGRTFRTVCVRLCDGAYFPVSYSTTRDRFARDEALCRSRCAAPARLFVFPNPGGSPETMRDLAGKSYAALPVAFQFRKGPTAGCSCRAEPWEEASIERHRRYAREAAGGLPHEPPASVGRLETRVAGWQAERGAADQVATAATDGPTGPSAADAAQATGSLAAVPEVVDPPEVADAAAETRIAAIGARVPVVSAAAAASLPRKAREVDIPLPAAKPLFAGKPPARLASKPVRKRVKVAAAVRGDKMAAAFAADSGTLVDYDARPRRNWGHGPNSALAPRGNSAYDVFARNFY